MIEIIIGLNENNNNAFRPPTSLCYGQINKYKQVQVLLARSILIIRIQEKQIAANYEVLASWIMKAVSLKFFDGLKKSNSFRITW